MKLPKLKEFDPILITWEDAHALGSDWHSIERSTKLLETLPTVSVGQFCFVLDDHIYFCRNKNTYLDNEFRNEIVDVDSMMKIPMSCIITVKKLK